MGNQLDRGYRIDAERMNEILETLSEDYRIYGPRMDARKKRVQYAEISRIEQIVYDRQSDFSPKSAFYPISQVMFRFREDRVDDGEFAADKDILIFAHPCDINAILRQDALFLKNGGAEDHFYKRLREKVHFILMECTESYEHCFCVSVGTNLTGDYALAVRFEPDSFLVQVKDDAFDSCFSGEKEEDFTIRFIQENKKKLRIPAISRENLKAISDLPYWSKFDDKCIACGGCNTVCGTCTCFDTVDVIYSEGSNEGERRRVWSGCMLENFTETAGGVRSRKTKGANMRFKVFHKFYDFKERFGKIQETPDGGDSVCGNNMCVGCGRCDIRCPKDISFFDTVCELHDEIEKMDLAPSAPKAAEEKKDFGNVWRNAQIAPGEDGAVNPQNLITPEPHRILQVTHETNAEFTFRVEFPYSFKNGQFCMLSIPKVGEAPISISGKGDGWVEFTIRKVGRLTEGVFELHEGSSIYLRGPFGHPWPVEEEFAGPDKNLLIISGGTGLAPVRTTLNYFYDHPEDIAGVYLISGFKDISGALYNEEREKWSKADHFHTIYTLDNSSAPGFETGMVTAHIGKIPFAEFGDNYNVAIVGPPPMMHFSALECMKNGVPAEKIWVSFERKMQCAVGKCGHCKINETYVCLEGPVFHYPKAKALFD